jgi:hypothetical protein
LFPCLPILAGLQSILFPLSTDPVVIDDVETTVSVPAIDPVSSVY